MSEAKKKQNEQAAAPTPDLQVRRHRTGDREESHTAVSVRRMGIQLGDAVDGVAFAGNQFAQ